MDAPDNGGGKSKKVVLDAGAFVEGRALEGVTTPGVCEEVNVGPGIEVIAPEKEFLEEVRREAEKSGDLDVLSRADIEVIALALQLGAKLATNDFAVQNVAKRLGIEVIPLGKEIKEEIEWVWYCPACGRTYERKGVCEFCGTELKRRPKSRKTLRKARD